MNSLKSCRTCLLQITDSEFNHYLNKQMQCGEETVELSEMISLCTGLKVSVYAIFCLFKHMKNYMLLTFTSRILQWQLYI